VLTRIGTRAGLWARKEETNVTNEHRRCQRHATGTNGALDLITVNPIADVPAEIAVFCARAFPGTDMIEPTQGAGPKLLAVPAALRPRGPRGRNSIYAIPIPPRGSEQSSHGKIIDSRDDPAADEVWIQNS